MSDEFEAVGTAIEGGLLAKAVDGDGNIVETEGGAAGNCLNCKATVTGNYCANCGQPLHVHRSIGAFWHDILHGVLHFEGKFWRTVPLLAWRPGELTRRYIHGERAGFISPMALFLFSVFLMFAVFSFIGSPFSGDVEDGGFTGGVAEESARLESEIAGLEKELAAPDLSQDDKRELQDDIDDLKRGRNVMATMTFSDPPYPEIDITDNRIASGTIEKKSGERKSDAGISGPYINSESNLNTGWPALDAKLTKAADGVNKNPSLLLYKLKANGYKFAWLLIPISVPFIWLTMVGRRGYRFYDHAVFATYSLSFMSLLFISCALMSAIGLPAPLIASLAIIYPPFHMYRQLRQAYQLSRLEAILRLFFLLIFTAISAVIFLVLLLVMGVLG